MIHQSHSWAYIQINHNSNRYMHPVFITALFIKAKTWKQHKCPSADEWRKTWYIREVTQSCPTLCDPTDCSLPGFSVHGIFQARVLEWVAISFSKWWRTLQPTQVDIRDLVWNLGQKILLEEGMAPCSSILTWEIPHPEEPGWLQSIGSKELDMTKAT